MDTPSSRPSLFTYLTAEAHASGFSSASHARQVVAKYGSAKKTVLVTGAGSAIGTALCAELCQGGATVLMGHRQGSEQQVAAVAEQLTAECAAVGGRAIPVRCDLSSLQGAQQCAAEVQTLDMRLHAIVHCAATTSAECQMTTDGIESHFAINYLNPLLLTLLLLPLLGVRRHSNSGGLGLPVSAKSGSEPPSPYAPRVVWCTCSAHHIAYAPQDSPSGCLLAWRVTGDAARTVFMPAQAFGQSKLAAVLVTRQLATRAAAAGWPLAVLAVHPGVTQEGLTKYGGYPSGSLLYGFKSVLAQTLASAGCLKSPGQAAATLAYAALAPELLDGSVLSAEDVWAGSVVGAGGALGVWGYLEDCSLSRPSNQARNVLDGDKLWEMTESLILSHLGSKVNCPLLRNQDPEVAEGAASADTLSAPQHTLE